MSEIATRNPAAELVEWVRSDDRREQIRRALPEDVSLETFERLTATALLQQPDLLLADRASLWLALLKAASVGLVPDGKQAFINVYNTKVEQGDREVTIKKATFQEMIGGVRDILGRYGWMLRTSVICENDDFAYDEGTDTPQHQRARLGTPRGEIIGAWAQAIHRDGRRMAEVMDRAQIEYVRDHTKSSPRLWTEWFPQACEKTVGHRLSKKVPLDPKDRAILARLDVTELEPGQSAAELYGPEPADLVGADGITATEETSETAGAPSSPEPAPAVAGDTDDEPGPSGELTADDMQALADLAGGYVPPTGKFSASGQNGPKSLAAIHEMGADGARWFAWALSKTLTPPEYAAAVTSYARVYCVAQYTEALAKKELAS